MIEILDKYLCCGCNACILRCPRLCLKMEEDEEGFLYPQVNEELCINCGLCEKVCPVINQNEKCAPLYVYAAKNKNEEVRLQSSSGGIFTLLAEKVIQEEGIVFGARFDENWEVIHDYTDCIEGIKMFRGSKYVQSKTGDSFKKVESFLKSGVKVLFSGTPCQIAGLKNYLHTDSENLMTVDFICHGVPSSKVWRMYLDESCNKFLGGNEKALDCIDAINFRSKKYGWKDFIFFLRLKTARNIKYLEENHKQNIYMRAFLTNLILRPSCYHCPSKEGKSGSDITIADFWGIKTQCPSMDDDKGTSLVLINTEKGRKLYYSIDACSYKTRFDVQSNIAFAKSARIPKLRNLYWKRINRGGAFQSITKYIFRIDYVLKLIARIRRKLHRIFLMKTRTK